MRSAPHSLSGGYLEDGDDRRHILTLLRVGQPVRRFTMRSLAVYGAAGYLLDLHPDPEALVTTWPDDLDAVGNVLVDEAAKIQAA